MERVDYCHDKCPPVGRFGSDYGGTRLPGQMQLSCAIFINIPNLHPLPASHLTDGPGISARTVNTALQWNAARNEVVDGIRKVTRKKKETNFYAFLFPAIGLIMLIPMTAWSTELFEKLIVSNLVNKLSDPYGTRRFIIVLIRASTVTYPEPDASSQSISFSYFPHVIKFPKWFLPFSFSGQNSVCISRDSLSFYMPRPSHRPWSDQPD
jgi:hypothetical protein